ncbi:copper chaperone PCu(A)C [Pacificibacter sp. AS14]|uniref:copper chaperone PCu(A)C n=1 Tax=Pacificibacter sp. AS14 TaxID=3135785 RepID=UPI003178677A
MSLKSTLLGGFTAILFALPAVADITIEDAYARSSGPSAKTGAAFFVIKNTSAEEDRLIGATSDVAKVVELHTHIEEDGIMKMRKVDDGFDVPAMGAHALQRGADHVMFMGLNAPMVQGETFDVTLTFENSGDITITVPVDLERTPEQGAMAMDKDKMDHAK